MTDPPRLQTRDDRRATLEAEKLELENLRLRLEAENFGRPTRADIFKMSFTFIGIVVPALIAVASLIVQQREVLQQRQQELRAERARDIERAWARIDQGASAAGILQLALYGQDAVPHLLSQVRVFSNSPDWPAPTLAALAALNQIGIEKLSEPSLRYLQSQAESGRASIERVMGNSADLPHPKEIWEVEATAGIVEEILSIAAISERVQRDRFERTLRNAQRFATRGQEASAGEAAPVF